LFTGGGGAGSEALDRLLGDRYVVHFADADAEAKPESVARESWHVVPLAAAPDFIEMLGRLCRELGIDMLIPGVDEELPAIAEARPRIAPHVLLPPAAFLARHLDKLASSLHLRSLGLPVAETEALLTRDRIPFPCIVKPRRGRGSRHVGIARSDDDLKAHVLLSRRPPDDFIVQELLDGEEYTVMIVADRAGGLRAVVPVKVAIKRGITLRAETDRDEAVIAACVAIHRADPVPGCFNVQLVKTSTGAVKPFEINPRISTTSCLAVAAGVDFVDLYLGDGRPGGQVCGLAPYRDRLRLRRSWRNEFVPPVAE
jgi:carbamoyl-phosphate synthase large subunit